MIRFARPLNAHSYRVFKDALERVQGEMEEEDYDLEDGAGWYTGGDDRVRQFGGWQEVWKQLDLIQRCFLSQRMWQISEWHWVLLYFVLKCSTDVHNDFCQHHREDKEKRQKEKDQKRKLGRRVTNTKQDKEDDAYYNDPYYAEEIDFEEMVDSYFWDEDFLLDPATAGDPKLIQALGLSDSLVQFLDGMPARPNDFEIIETPEVWEEWKKFLDEEASNPENDDEEDDEDSEENSSPAHDRKQ